VLQEALQIQNATQIQNIALEKVCNKGMTFKDTEGHHNCCIR